MKLSETKQNKPRPGRPATTSHPCDTFKFETHPGGVKIKLFHLKKFCLKIFDWFTTILASAMWAPDVSTRCEHHMWTPHVNTTCEHHTNFSINSLSDQDGFVMIITEFVFKYLQCIWCHMWTQCVMNNLIKLLHVT